MAKHHPLTDWLPTSKKEMEAKGWDEADVILFSGDAYVDHPSFGAAVVGRILEAEGLRVAIVPQPGATIFGTSANWDVLACFSEFRQERWIRW